MPKRPARKPCKPQRRPPAGAFCACCIDGPAEVPADDILDVTVWLCRRCENGADHSLPVNVDQIENQFTQRHIYAAALRNPDASARDIAEMLGLDVDGRDSGYTCASVQRVYRVMRTVKRAA